MDESDLRSLRDKLYADLHDSEGLAGIGITDGQLTIYTADIAVEANLRKIIADKALQVPVRFLVIGPTRLT